MTASPGELINPESLVITLNYDVALERALAKAGKWDIGTGYGFTAFSGRSASPTAIYKLHGSVNWFQAPIQDDPPPLMFSRDLKLLGYEDLSDPRVGGNGNVGINNTGTLILPDPDKQFYWERFWSPLWRTAAARLRQAREVFIHGYSMPQSDRKARELLFDNINPRATVNVHCLGDSDRIADEFRALGFADARSFPMTGFEAWATAPE